MSGRQTARARGLLVLVAAAVIAAAVGGSPDPVVLAAPAAAALAIGLGLPRRPSIVASAQLAPARVTEGGTATLTVSLRSDAAVPVVACRPTVGARAEARQIRTALEPDVAVTLRSEVRLPRWGVHDLGALEVEGRDALGMIAWRSRFHAWLPVRVYPPSARLLASPTPFATTAATGSHVSRERGEGIEFAEVREYRPGDRVRALNPRVTARRGRPYVNDRHPERSADVVLFLDTFAAAVGPDGSGTLDLALHAATAIAEHHLARRDRVGLVGFGGIVSWLPPGLGERQRGRIADAMLESEVVVSYVPKHVRFLPPRALPPRALVIALSALIDERSHAALVDLRRRGVDLAVVELDVRPFIPHPRGREQELALRLWRLRHWDQCELAFQHPRRARGGLRGRARGGADGTERRERVRGRDRSRRRSCRRLRGADRPRRAARRLDRPAGPR